MLNRLKYNKDFLIGLGILIFSVYIIYESINIPVIGESSVAMIHPGFVPGSIGVFLLICSLILMFSSLRTKVIDDLNVKPIMEVNLRSISTLRFVVTILLVLAYYYTLPVLGFLITTWAFLTGMMFLTKAGKWWKVIILSLIITLIISYFFVDFLRVQFPHGIFR